MKFHTSSGLSDCHVHLQRPLPIILNVQGTLITLTGNGKRLCNDHHLVDQNNSAARHHLRK